MIDGRCIPMLLKLPVGTLNQELTREMVQVDDSPRFRAACDMVRDMELQTYKILHRLSCFQVSRFSGFFGACREMNAKARLLLTSLARQCTNHNSFFEGRNYRIPETEFAEIPHYFHCENSWFAALEAGHFSMFRAQLERERFVGRYWIVTPWQAFNESDYETDSSDDSD
jgi:hypothetical protein